MMLMNLIVYVCILFMKRWILLFIEFVLYSSSYNLEFVSVTIISFIFPTESIHLYVCVRSNKITRLMYVYWLYITIISTLGYDMYYY